MFFEFAGLFDPQAKMFVVRLLHAGFSLLTVYYSYKITERISDKKVAAFVGLLFAVYWFQPFLSVRNLVEVVCIPPLIAGVWVLYRKDRISLTALFISGLLLSIAFSIRFQTAFFTGGIGLVLLFNRNWKGAFIFGVSYLAGIGIVQGIVDFMVWGYPFAELTTYILHNINNAYNYLTGPWYNYLLVVLGILIPPVSFFLFFGFFRMWKKHLLIFLPVLLFFVFHSAFPNKQERFILPVIPFIIILGTVGWFDFIKNSGYGKKIRFAVKVSWIFFWIINLCLLPVISTMYSKKARVESMLYLSKYENIQRIMLEDSNHSEAKYCPRFYLGQWVSEYQVAGDYPLEELPAYVYKDLNVSPRFILFFEDTDLDNRVEKVKELFPEIVFEVEIKPGFVDSILTWMNPVNANQTIFIYRNKKVYDP